MRQAKKIIFTESITYEVGQPYKEQGIISHINVAYPIARIFIGSSNKPVAEIFLQVYSTIEWVDNE